MIADLVIANLLRIAHEDLEGATALIVQIDSAEKSGPFRGHERRRAQ